VLKGAAIGAITGAITGGVAQKFASSYSYQRVFYEAANGGLGSTLRGQKFEDGFKFAAVVSALTWANSAMRSDQIEKSRGIHKDSGGNAIDNIGEPGQSKGFLGDGYKLGGGRFTENVNLNQECGAACAFGGWQADPGQVGSGDWATPYAAGSWQDAIIESYAGPHDWMREYISRSTLPNGFAASFTGARAAGDMAANAALIVPATYFAVPAAAPAAGYEIHSRCGTELQHCR
jgi:filamentous hemagglutinin